MRIAVLALCAFAFAACSSRAEVQTGNLAIDVGTLEADPPTLVSLGVYLPIVRGDDNRNAVAHVKYREQGTNAWLTGVPLLRVRPEFAGIEREESFAGSIFGLNEGTTYEVEVNIVDPDGGSTTRSLVISTRGYPTSAPLAPRAVDVASPEELTKALSNAAPGDVITLAPGTYVGDFVVERGVNGTPQNPIFIRGSDREAVVLRGKTSHGFQIYGDYVTLEDITLEAGESGIGLVAKDCEGVVIRRTRITNVDKGIMLTRGTNRNFDIYENVLEGRNRWPDISRSTWNDEGIAVAGEGHAIFENTLFGFGDALGLSRFGDIRNRSIDFYRNEVLWTGDDGIELDDGERNVRAFENRVTNSGTLISVQHNKDTGGPVYAFRNVGINQAMRPFKLNDSPSGFYLLHNTAVKSLGKKNWLWAQYNNGKVQNFYIKNNILLSISPLSKGILFQAPVSIADFDFNGYYPIGRSRSFGRHDVLLDRAPFESEISLGPDYATFAMPQDFTLRASSEAIDAGAVIPNINDGYVGDAPDLGAHERGTPIPKYGAGWLPATFSPTKN